MSGARGGRMPSCRGPHAACMGVGQALRKCMALRPAIRVGVASPQDFDQPRLRHLQVASGAGWRQRITGRFMAPAAGCYRPTWPKPPPNPFAGRLALVPLIIVRFETRAKGPRRSTAPPPCRSPTPAWHFEPSNSPCLGEKRPRATRPTQEEQRPQPDQRHGLVGASPPPAVVEGLTMESARCMDAEKPCSRGDVRQEPAACRGRPRGRHPQPSWEGPRGSLALCAILMALHLGVAAGARELLPRSCGGPTSFLEHAMARHAEAAGRTWAQNAPNSGVCEAWVCVGRAMYQGTRSGRGAVGTHAHACHTAPPNARGRTTAAKLG